MTHNVLILGAGFSHDAGIPLLSGVVDRMLEIVARGTLNNHPVAPDDLDILEAATRVRDELDGYHGRASFNDRNIEDILSILAFNVLGGGANEKRKLERFTRAIARTIELSCAVIDPRLKNGSVRAISDEPVVYRDFWKALFNWLRVGNALPTILTFNYDLVLERSLLQLLNNTIYDGHTEAPSFQRLRVRYYHHDSLDKAFSIGTTHYGVEGPRSGICLTPTDLTDDANVQSIDILKPHGSLNFPKSRRAANGGESDLATALDDPHILPPVFNKLAGNDVGGIWKEALLRLREARNVVFVGYSLPETDIYMQYFLKAALGPNSNLNRVIVIDPVLDMGGAQEMCSRYESCFAPQLKSRIDFNPAGIANTVGFVNNLQERPELILF